jgi:hypothetical protein
MNGFRRRDASPIQIVCPSRSRAEMQRKLQPALLIYDVTGKVTQRSKILCL